MKGKILSISRRDAVDFLLPRHYSARTPSISKAFGWIINGNLSAVCTVGKPASPSLCRGLMGKEYACQVYELNRLCRIDSAFEQPISTFVSACLRRLRPENWIIVSYADTDMNHTGYVYQACNFLYTGTTTERTDKYTKGNKHSRHYKEEEQGELRKMRSEKHRYVFFCSHHKSLKKQWSGALKYEVLPYPKGENSNYQLGDYQPIRVVNKDGDQSAVLPNPPTTNTQNRFSFYDEAIREEES